MVLGQSSDQASREASKNLPGPGVRMIGQYSSPGGLALEFQDVGVTLDCGEAHVVRPYVVENGASQVLVTVKNGASPFTLAVRPDGTLTGSGSAEVVGRVVTGSSGNGIDFAQRSQVCTIGVLAPKTGGGSTPATDGAASSSAASPSGGTAVLSLATSGFPIEPGRPSPLNGLTVYLLKESFADILTKAGIRPAAGMSVIQAWGAACDRQAPECAQAMKTVQSYVAGTVKLDMEGKASFPAMPSATYHVFSWTSDNNRHLVWDLKVDLKFGSNGVILDQGNAILL